jgi:hypothetical protein
VEGKGKICRMCRNAKIYENINLQERLIHNPESSWQVDINIYLNKLPYMKI